MKRFLIIAVLTAAVLIPLNMKADLSNKEKLLNNIIQKQSKVELQIVDLWLTGDRGNEMDVLLSEYITLEVRYRAISGKDKNNSLLNNVTQNKYNSNSTHIDLAKNIVIEYFKQKGIDMENENFVNAKYYILNK